MDQDRNQGCLLVNTVRILAVPIDEVCYLTRTGMYGIVTDLLKALRNSGHAVPQQDARNSPLEEFPSCRRLHG
jgi:hypothetical protein